MGKYWKWLFFSLLTLNIGVVIFLYSYLTKSTEQTTPPDDQEEDTFQYVPFQIKTSKHDLNRLINHYIEEEYGNGPIEYKVVLKDEVELYGSIPVFGQNLALFLSFVPEVLENGDLMLRQKSVSIGELEPPISFVLKFISNQYHFPDWVIIQPEEGIVYLSVKNIQLKSNMKVMLDHINLKNDDIRFTLLVPTK